MVSGRWVSALAVVVTGVGFAAGQPGQPVQPAGVKPPLPSVLPVSNSEPKLLDVTPPELKEHGGHGGGHGEYPPGGPVKTLCHVEEEIPGQFFGSGEFLIWRPRLDSTDYALVDPTNNLTPQGKVRNLKYDSNGGFRVGMGYRVPGQGWDVGVTYTYFRTNGDAAVGAPPGGVIYPTLTRPGVVDRVGTAAVSGGLDYNVFDLDVGRTWEVDPHFVMRAFGGVRWARINLDQTATYNGIHANNAVVRNSADFTGTGPTAGLEARWAVTHGLAMFGNVRGGLLYGEFGNAVRETNGNGQVLNADVSDDFTGLAPFASVALGGSYTWNTLTFSAGYEVTQYFNLSTRPVLVDDFAEGKVVRRRSDLNFDGVFFRVALAY